MPARKTKTSTDVVDCQCGTTVEDGCPMVQCFKCAAWEHISCTFSSSDTVAKSAFFCHWCKCDASTQPDPTLTYMHPPKMMSLLTPVHALVHWRRKQGGAGAAAPLNAGAGGCAPLQICINGSRKQKTASGYPQWYGSEARRSPRLRGEQQL